MSLLDTIFIQRAIPSYMIDLARGALLEVPNLIRSIFAWSNNRVSATEAVSRGISNRPGAVGASAEHQRRIQ